MSVHAAPHFRFAWLPSSVIALDLRADRYLRLGFEVAEALDEARKGRLSAAGRGCLERAGILTADCRGRPIAPIRIAPAQEAALSGTWMQRGGELGAVAIMRALAVARIRLRANGLAAALASAERSARRAKAVNSARAVAIARQVDAVRAWFPVQRRCLPDSLALHRLLAEAGVVASLVIGVRDRPFAAHCWVQDGCWLLNDTLDDIAELTPILVL